MEDGRQVLGLLSRPHDTGRVEAAILAADILSRYSPKLIILAGIAGGFRRYRDEYWKHNIALGDVVVADRIVDTEFQKLTAEGPQFRDRTFPVDRHLLEEVSSIFNLSKPVKHLNRWRQEQLAFRQADYFSVHLGTVISANKIVASTEAQIELGQRVTAGLSGFPLAVEMEGIGVAMAASRYGVGDRFLMVRSINDYANEAKSEDEEIWRMVACSNAAAFTVEIVRKILVRRRVP